MTFAGGDLPQLCQQQCILRWSLSYIDWSILTEQALDTINSFLSQSPSSRAERDYWKRTVPEAWDASFLQLLKSAFGSHSQRFSTASDRSWPEKIPTLWRSNRSWDLSPRPTLQLNVPLASFHALWIARGTDVSPQLGSNHQCSFSMQPPWILNSFKERPSCHALSYLISENSDGPWIRDDPIPWDDASNSISQHGMDPHLQTPVFLAKFGQTPRALVQSASDIVTRSGRKMTCIFFQFGRGWVLRCLRDGLTLSHAHKRVRYCPTTINRSYAI